MCSLRQSKAKILGTLQSPRFPQDGMTPAVVPLVKYEALDP